MKKRNKAQLKVFEVSCITLISMGVVLCTRDIVGEILFGIFLFIMGGVMWYYKEKLIE